MNNIKYSFNINFNQIFSDNVFLKKQQNNKVSFEGNQSITNISGSINDIDIPSSLTGILSGDYSFNYNIELLTEIPSRTNFYIITL